MSDKVNFSKTLFSVSAPGADYFERGRDISAHLHRHGRLTELTALNRLVLSHVVYVKLHDFNVQLLGRTSLWTNTDDDECPPQTV